MNKSQKRNNCRWPLVSFVLFASLLAGLAFLAEGSSAPAQLNTVASVLANRRTSGGWVLKNPDCGCPTPRPTWDAAESWDWPTRCIDKNRYAGGLGYRPINDYDVAYPNYKYPNGFPYNYTFAPNFPWAGPGRAGAEIPFPGWPAVKPPRSRDGVSTWDEGNKRVQYKRQYTNRGANDPPGWVSQAHTVVYDYVGWEDWQIHHILERKHNGTDDPKNLVPVYAFPRSWAGNDTSLRNLNLHSQYTQWWQQIRVDSQLSRRRNTWSKIRGCEVVQWPG